MPRSKAPYRIDAKIGMALEKHLQAQPEKERDELEIYINELSHIKHIGRVSSLEILWSIGRMMNSE